MAIEFPERPTMCATGDLLQPEIYQETLATSNVYNVLTIVCYVSIWILVIWKKEKNPNIRRLLNSLTAIIVVNFSGTVNAS
uniref:G_PROTEIN_RECEP_F1_2 domain-containing protein n=1 Tax=Meloidogyne hapla TaxID=6305 RepID=A0A1I8BD93_MELHA